MYYVLLIISLFTFLISLAIFVDRFILSGIGFKNLLHLTFLYVSFMAGIGLTLLSLIKVFPSFFNTSIFWVMMFYHSISFLTINILFISITYIIFHIDFLIKKYNFFIFTRSNISYLNLLGNKRFLILSLGISYFLTTIVILFPIPQLILSMVGHEKSAVDFISSEIKTYQQLFVFASIPILFSLIKKK